MTEIGLFHYPTLAWIIQWSLLQVLVRWACWFSSVHIILHLPGSTSNTVIAKRKAAAVEKKKYMKIIPLATKLVSDGGDNQYFH
jgi:hypothetical protein